LQETAFSREEVVGKDLRSLKLGLDDPKVSGSVWQTVQENSHWSGEVLSRTKSGEIASEWLSLSEIKDEEGKTSNYIAVFTNISHLASRQRQLERAAHYDVLTKLPNRLLLSDRLELAMAHADRTKTMLAVCFMDLDGFKPVNDQYGHAAGDHVLISTAHRVKTILRANDTMARIGGDEFIILLNNIKSDTDCQELLDRLIVEVSRPIAIEDASVCISASIGVAFYPMMSNLPDELVNLADQAMYTAKDLGKSRYHFHAEFV
jgi:diguanylate cyclase (GGDEF)-like protein